MSVAPIDPTPPEQNFVRSTVPWATVEQNFVRSTVAQGTASMGWGAKAFQRWALSCSSCRLAKLLRRASASFAARSPAEDALLAMYPPLLPIPFPFPLGGDVGSPAGGPAALPLPIALPDFPPTSGAAGEATGGSAVLPLPFALPAFSPTSGAAGAAGETAGGSISNDVAGLSFAEE